MLGLCFTCMPLSSVLKMFPGVSKSLYSFTKFSSVLQNFQRVFRFILWALAKDQISTVTSCSSSSKIEIIWNSQFSNNPVCSGANSLSVWGKKPYAPSLWICAIIFMVFVISFRVPVPKLKLFEIPNSLITILYAVTRTVCLCGGKNLMLRVSEYVQQFLWFLSSVSENNYSI